MNSQRFSSLKFVSGSLETGMLVLTREDGSTSEADVVVVRGVSLVDNDDSTFDLVFDGS
jgi:hypothetical protein